jgi:hypothetical protein
MSAQRKKSSSAGRRPRFLYPLKVFFSATTAAVMFASFFFADGFLQAHDTIVIGNARFLTDWQVETGSNLSDFSHSTDTFPSFSLPDSILTDPAHDYIRMVTEIAPASVERTVTINTYGNQMILRVNQEKVLDTIDETSSFAAPHLHSVSLQPSETPVFLEAVFRVGFLPRITATIENGSASTLSIPFSAAAAIVVAVFTLILSSIGATFGFSSRVLETRIKLLTVSGSIFLFCLFLVALAAGAFIVPSGLWLFRLGFGFAMLSAVVLYYGFFSAHRTQSPFLTPLLSAGILIAAIYLITGYEIFSLALLKFFPYYLGLVFLSLQITLLRASDRYKPSFIGLLSVDLSGLAMASLWWPTLRQNGFFPVFVVLTALLLHCAVSLGETLVYQRQMKRKEQTVLSDDNSLMAYRPENLGNIEKLLEIFLQSRSNLDHVRNVSLYVYEICFQSGMPHDEAAKVAKASFLHDIGKIMVPLRTVTKESTLTAEEYEQIKKHAQYGYEILASSSDDFLQTAALIAKQHHERVDGNGYNGLRGNQIHPYAQITCIADVFEATTATRKYKATWSFDEGFDYIVSHSGIYFSPFYVEAFKKCRNEIFAIYNRVQQLQLQN